MEVRLDIPKGTRGSKSHVGLSSKLGNLEAGTPEFVKRVTVSCQWPHMPQGFSGLLFSSLGMLTAYALVLSAV